MLRLVARGLSNREIGAELFISEHTAANHIRNILRKTECSNRTEAASYAHSHGLVEPAAEGRSGSAHAALHDRADLRRGARPHRRNRTQIDEINADEGVRWLFSFLSADRRRTYCLYEAP